MKGHTEAAAGSPARRISAIVGSCPRKQTFSCDATLYGWPSSVHASSDCYPGSVKTAVWPGGASTGCVSACIFSSSISVRVLSGKTLLVRPSDYLEKF